MRQSFTGQGRGRRYDRGRWPTALCCAAGSGQFQAVQLLVENGAKTEGALVAACGGFVQDAPIGHKCGVVRGKGGGEAGFSKVRRDFTTSV